MYPAQFSRCRTPVNLQPDAIGPVGLDGDGATVVFYFLRTGVDDAGVALGLPGALMFGTVCSFPLSDRLFLSI